MLGKRGAKLGLEFDSTAQPSDESEYAFIQTADAMLMLLKTIGSPTVGLALDVWHWHLGGGTHEQLHALGAGRIITVSLADADVGAFAASAKPSERRLPGETGVIDSAAIVASLAEQGYDGPVTPRPRARCSSARVERRSCGK